MRRGGENRCKLASLAAMVDYELICVHRIEELQELDLQRKLQRPEEPIESMTNGHESEIMEVDEPSEAEAEQIDENSSSDSEPIRGRGRRRSGRASQLKRKHEELARHKEEQRALIKAKEQSDERAAYEQILLEIETKRAEIRACEEEVALVDGKLRENSCHRTKCLGVDRFCNRYWWYERNGMPFAGHEDSSTAENGYANGRLWVQGPGQMEIEGFFDIPEPEAKPFREMSGMSPSERKAKEEGTTHLKTDTDWGYLSTPADLDALMTWLDERGLRERALLKELTKWKFQIVESMSDRSAHLSDVVQRRRQAIEEPIHGVATRKKTTTAESNKLKHPCFEWTNSEAIRELGHLHSDGPAPKKMRGLARPKTAGGFTAVNHILPGKRETRRGTKY